MASTCLRLLGSEASSEASGGEGSEEKLRNALVALTRKDTTQELRMLSTRLLKRDLAAFTDLGERLLAPGGVTIHQFIDIVLPTLHSAFLGRASSDNDGVAVRTQPGRRSKKARVVDVPEESSPEERLCFCKQAIRLILTGENSKEDAAAINETDEMQSEDGSDDTNENPADSQETKEQVIGGGGHYVKYSDVSQELLRRLHQVLAFHERVDLISSLGDGPSGRKAGDLQGLTTPLDIELLPSSFGGTHSTTALDTPLHVLAQPLIPVQELQLHILRTCNNWDRSYVEFSRR